MENFPENFLTGAAMTSASDTGALIKVEAGISVIRIPLSEVHGLRMALAECPCRATKSTATADIRQRLAKAHGKVGA